MVAVCLEDCSLLSSLVLGFLAAELELLMVLHWGRTKQGGLSRSKSAAPVT